MAFDLNKIEEKIDRVITGAIELNDDGFGIEIKRLVDAMEIAKLMAISGPAIPSFMRGNPGLCYACVVRAVRWRIDPFFVAEHSYLVNNRGEEKVAYDAQLIMAVINARAPLQKMMSVTYSGTGEDMMATVTALPKGQTDVLEYETPTIKELIAIKGRNEYGKVKGSPLYDNDPKQALWYYGSRGMCRRHFPHVLAGVYDREEFEPAEPKDVTPERPTLSQRLKGQKKIEAPRGFDAEHIARETEKSSDVLPVAGNPDAPTSGSTDAPSVIEAGGADFPSVLGA